MSVKLLTEHHLEYLSLKGGCKDLSESTLVTMPHCWKSHAAAYLYPPHLWFRLLPAGSNAVVLFYLIHCLLLLLLFVGVLCLVLVMLCSYYFTFRLL